MLFRSVWTVAVGLRVRPVCSARAERNVERIVHATEAEALRRLDVDRKVAARLIADDEARVEAVALGLVADVAIAIGEDTTRDEVPRFLEVIVAATGGQLELAHLVAGFAEDGELLDLVRSSPIAINAIQITKNPIHLAVGIFSCLIQIPIMNVSVGVTY